MSETRNDSRPAARDEPYDASAIVVLPGLTAVRRNPSMYIGSTGPDGLYQLVSELVDNAVDEAKAGHCREIVVILHTDGSCTVADDGRGLPVDDHPDLGRPGCEVVLTTLHSGGKFEGHAYGRSAGLHGIGLSCVSALSEWLHLDVWRDGAHYVQSFAHGERVTDLARVGSEERRGTRIRFRPDPSVLLEVAFDAGVIALRLEEISYLHPGLALSLIDQRTGSEHSYVNEAGVRGLLAGRTSRATPVHAEPVVLTHQTDDLTVELAVQWTEEYTEEIWSFANTVRTDRGGNHVDALRSALVAAVNRYAVERGLLADLATDRLGIADLSEGLRAVIAVWMNAPQFDAQTKGRLRSPEVGRVVRALVEREFFQRLCADEEIARSVVTRAVDATRARLAARLAGRVARFQRRAVDLDYAAYRRQFGIRSRNWHESCTWLTDAGLLATHAALCDVAPDAKMLDVCCGSGVVGHAFKGRVGEMIGLDITPEMVELASSRLDKVHQGTVYDLPFADRSFQLVVNREVLHLLPRPERPVSEVFRVLEPGGQFIVGQIVPYADEDAFWMYRIFKKKQPLLFQMFREDDFRSLLLGAGFVDLKMEEYLLWESIDRWIDTHETSPLHRQQIYRLYYDAPAEVREVHPFEVAADGSVRDQWRWCVYSVRKPA